MWRILLLSWWSSFSIQDVTWYPSAAALGAILGEQIDLVDSINASYTPNWARNAANNGVNDATTNLESVDSRYSPADRDREPLDEVERIEPRQWPGRPDILPTRSTAPFTTETSLSPKSPQPTTLAQRNPTQRCFKESMKVMQKDHANTFREHPKG